MFTDRGANLALEAADLPHGLLADAVLLHFSGYQFFEPATRLALEGLRRLATGTGVPISVDPASVAGLGKVGADAFLEWTAGARFVFPNEQEGAFLTGERAAEDIVDALLLTYEVVALKLGRGGALVAGRGGEPVRVEACQAEAIDSTGAGDAFCAAFLDAWVRGVDLAGCARRAVFGAALAVARLGARPPVA